MGTWTAILDELARELDILIVVSAGNYNHVAPTPEDHLLGYPGYLLCEESRLFEPAIAANVLAVGAVAGASALENRLSHNVSVRPIANVGEPAPFTRGGPGIGGAIKPDLCDDGGNICFDGTLQMVSRRPESEILTMHPNYLDRLFTTVQGTSHAAPLVAHKAGLVLQSFPDASANLLRALLATSAKLPEPSVRKLAGLGKQATRNLCGYGIANPTLASTSEPNRVVLYADADIGMDKFLVYEVPMPANFTQTDGSREIRVTLAFDPPTRHTRAAYLGVAMSFRLIRGRTLEQVIEHFRQRNVKTDGLIPDFDNRYNCKFDLGPKVREPGTLQSACFRMAQNPNPQYGETYYLMVRCQRKWMPDDLAMQRFALVVQLTHEADINVYEHVRNRARVRLRA